MRWPQWLSAILPAAGGPVSEHTVTPWQLAYLSITHRRFNVTQSRYIVTVDVLKHTVATTGQLAYMFRTHRRFSVTVGVLVHDVQSLQRDSWRTCAWHTVATTWQLAYLCMTYSRYNVTVGVLVHDIQSLQRDSWRVSSGRIIATSWQLPYLCITHIRYDVACWELTVAATWRAPVKRKCLHATQASFCDGLCPPNLSDRFLRQWTAFPCVPGCKCCLN